MARPRSVPEVKWIPLVGSFAQERGSTAFRGEVRSSDSGKPTPAVGILLSDQVFGGGTVEANIEFTVSSGDEACALILYYQPSSQAFVAAQLGGSDLVSLWDYVGGKWTNYGRAGTSDRIEPEKRYHFRVTVNGSQVIMSLDGVDVLASTLPMPLARGQAGLFVRSTSTIRVSGFAVKREKPTAFVVMQFTAPYNELFVDVIKPVCEQLGLDAIRADEKFGPGVIIRDIEKQINEAKVIIADVTPTNANVYYEVGYAHALQKPTILIAENATKLPFDVSPFRTLFYDNTIAGKARVEAGLRSHLEAIQTEW
jgi:hypothetical protein